MLQQPRTQGRRDDGGVLCFVGCREGFLLLQRRLNVLEEIDVERVAFVEVGKVAVEAVLGVFVREESGVLEFPAEDYAEMSGWTILRIETGTGSWFETEGGVGR